MSRESALHRVGRPAPHRFRVQRERLTALAGLRVLKVRKYDGPAARGLWYHPCGAQRTHLEGALATRKM